MNGPLEDEFVVLRICHTSSADGDQLAFVDEAGQVVDLLSRETAMNGASQTHLFSSAQEKNRQPQGPGFSS
ncbi:MAG: hypothetical protein WEB00_00330 [Dehalococcoidia bacterium]